MKKAKSPAPARVQGLGAHRADDDQAYTATLDETQFSTPEEEIAPSIHVRRDGAFYRMAIVPPEALPPAMARPSTYGSYASAMLAARWLEVETGWPVVDLAKGG